MFTPPIAAGLHSSGSLKALTAALLSSSSLLIYRLYYIEIFPAVKSFMRVGRDNPLLAGGG